MRGWKPGTGPTLAEAAGLLADRDLTIEGRLPWSSNLTFLVRLDGTEVVGPGSTDEEPPERHGVETGFETGVETDVELDVELDVESDDRIGDGFDGGPDDGGESDGVPVRAVYKPHQGERALWDFPDGLFRREAAAYALSEALGWGLVPPTVVRHDAPFGSGSLQLFIESDYRQHYFTLLEEGDRDDELRVFCAFDIVANNADRKSGHVLYGSDGRLWGIDHGLCFHAQHKLRTVIWEFAEEEVPDRIVGDLRRLVEVGLPDDLLALVSGAEAEAVIERAARLAAVGHFPEPLGDRPPYPWPLV
ncbi:MAG: SCO1664 family protein [Acidimicrobiales bacterium]